MYNILKRTLYCRMYSAFHSRISYSNNYFKSSRRLYDIPREKSNAEYDICGHELKTQYYICNTKVKR